MEANDESKSSTPVGSYAGRRRSISIVEAEGLVDNAPKQPSLGGSTEVSQPPLPSPLHYQPQQPDPGASKNNGSTSASASVGASSVTGPPGRGVVGMPHAPPSSASRGGTVRLDEPAFSSGSSSTTGGGGFNGSNPFPRPLSSASERASLFHSPSYRVTPATSQTHLANVAVNANGNNSGDSHVLASPGGQGNAPTSWRRVLSPVTSVGTFPVVPYNGSTSNSAVNPNTNGPQRQQRPPSLLYRRPSSSTVGGHGLGRGVLNNTNNNNNAVAASAPTNVYTLQLTEDDGGAEMAAARPLLLEALRLRDTYKELDKGQIEMGGNSNNNSNNCPVSSSLNPTSTFGAPPTINNGLTALQQVDGVFYWTDEKTPIVPWLQFTADVMAVAICVQHQSCLAVAQYRLQVLEEKYHLHRLYNADAEENGDRYRRGGGLYANACRVDNCVGLSTAMNAHWLVEYMKQTIETRGGDVVESAEVNLLTSGRLNSNNGNSGGGDGNLSGNGSLAGGGGGDAQTLERICELLDFPDPHQLTVEGLGLQPSVNRALPSYDALDPALNGSGRNSAALLRLFLSLRHSSSAAVRGDYLAGAVQPSLTRNELRTSCLQATEMVLEITGVLSHEWEQTAAWVRANEFDSYRTNQFQIAFPITKWCLGGGSDGRFLSNGAAASDKPSPRRGRGDGSGDGPSGVSSGGSESQGVYKMSGRGGGGDLGRPSSSIRSRNYSSADASATEAAVPLDASPEDVLTYENYQQLLDHLFLPLFMATLAPEDPKFVDLASFLQHIGAILLTGDETARTRGGLGTGAGGGGVVSSGASGRGHDGEGGAGVGDSGGGGSAHGSPLSNTTDLIDSGARRRRPADVPYTEPVSLTYMCYHIWANLCSLNALRRRRGLNVLQLRVVAPNATIANTSSPHDASLLLLSYLIADVVVDAVALEKQPVLQYLYGMHQIGVTMCPIARGSLGTTNLHDHPIAPLLWRGLLVSLCTISPLYYHASPEPLLEEYAAAAKCHRLSPIDISELSLHSVCMSAFEEDIKALWVGAAFLRDGWRGNVAELTSVPTARLQLRHDSWAVERTLLHGSSLSPCPSPGGEGTESTIGTLSRTSKRGSTTTGSGAAAIARSRETLVSTGHSRFSTTTNVGTPPRRAGSAASTIAQSINSGGSVGMGQQTQQSPYTVLDPAVTFPRLFLMGPYDRDIAHAHIAQSLHRALDLRHQYSVLPLAQPSTLPPSEASIEAAAGTDGNKADVRNSWLAALIHDPQAVLPHPTESMSWAFNKSPPPAAGGGGSGGSTAVVVAGAGTRPHLHFDEDEWKYKTVEGVIVPHEVHQIPRLPQDMYHYEDFCRHVQEIRDLIDHIRVREFALRRLQLLEHRFNLHAAVNHSLELGSTAGRASQNRDFYQSTKVDNNIRMETGITARQLLAFIVDKATHNGDDIVSHPKGKEPQTLRQLLSELHISPYSLTVDDLNIQAGATSSDGGAPHNPFASDGTQDELLTLLLKTDNQMNGRYFAELTKRTFEELSRDQHTFTESRLPIYGASAGEWGLLSHWFDTHGMSSSHNQWVVQVPRIYSSLRRAGRVASFAEYLEHIFEPLWRISLHPNSDPRLFHFVNHIAAFDCVEDERRPDMPLHRASRAPHEWTSEEEPPYNYYLYHIYANLRSLNRFRQRRRFSVFAFRPSCGEAGSVDHLIGGFLLAQNINYGVRLADSAPLQYLFYLAQIGVTMSPLSNNTKLDLNYLNNPFPEFFRRGLRVSLGTDSPLLYHHTQEPLLEEYSIASKIWKLSPNDLSEVARNSVLLSNFSVSFKEEKLGPLYFLSSSAGNDAARTHLSDVRVAYRFETYHTEVGFLEYISGQHFHKALLTLTMEAQCKQLCGCLTRNENGKTNRTTEEDDGKRKPSGPSATRSGGLSSPPSARTTTDVLIDPTPKEADVKQLEQQRARMQRQLHELTNVVADLHKQNRLLTAKLGEEKERDQQAAHLRRHRVGDKLRELQVLLDQKEVQPSVSMVALTDGGAAAAAAAGTSGISNRRQDEPESPQDALSPAGALAVAALGMAASSRSASLLPFTATSVSPSRGLNSNISALAHERSSNNYTNKLLSGSGEGALSAGSSSFAAGDAAASVKNSISYTNAAPDRNYSAPPAPALSSHDICSTVRNRKATEQREETIAKTRQLLAHSESLWRPSAPSGTTAAMPSTTGSAQRQGGPLPPLDTTSPGQRKRYSPSPSLQD